MGPGLEYILEQLGLTLMGISGENEQLKMALRTRATQGQEPKSDSSDGSEEQS